MKTPFDDMTHDEIVRFAKRAYWALLSARSVMDLTRSNQSLPWELDPFWNNGTGANGYDLAVAVLQDIPEWWDPENGFAAPYRGYYRTAAPMLYEDAKHVDGSAVYPAWWACDGCDRFYRSPEIPSRDGPPDLEKCYFCGSTTFHMLTLEEIGEGSETPA